MTENIFRSVNIALVNELKVIFDAMDIDVWDVIEGAATKPFGFMPFYPGPGLGGHCIPIDPFYLTYKAREYDVPTRFIELAGEINTKMPHLVVAKTGQALNMLSEKALKNSTILLIGMAYKKNIDDMRESPSLVLTELLEAEGANVVYHDALVPVIPDTREHGELAGRKSVDLTPKLISQVDAVLVSTNHDGVDYQLLADNARLIIDTRNAMKDTLRPSDSGEGIIMKVAVIGCGHWGKNLVRNFAELDSLCAVSDSNETLAAQFSLRYKVPSVDFDTVLSSDCDGVVIATPAPLHADLAKKAFMAGKHVYVEKPMAMTLDEADEIIEAGRKAGRHLMVGHLLQYHPVFARLRDMVKQGEFGGASACVLKPPVIWQS